MNDLLSHKVSLAVLSALNFSVRNGKRCIPAVL